MSPQRIIATSSVALILFLLVPSGRAQGGDQASTAQSEGIAEFEAQKDSLRERNRSAMHPGDPLLIIGVEQGDNDIRSRSPALLQSDRAATRVDAEEAHERRLALFDSGGLNQQAVTVPRSPAAATRAVVKKQSASEGVETTTGRHILAWCIGLLISTLFTAWMFKRFGHLVLRVS